MENLDKGLTVPKWVLINWPKIPQMTQNLSAQKFGISMKKASLGVRSPWSCAHAFAAGEKTQILLLMVICSPCSQFLVSRVIGLLQPRCYVLL